MTDIYHFEGFDEPKSNWTKTPNGIIEAMSHMSGAEFKCVMYIVRHTWGFHQQDRRITLDEFVSGRRKRDRSRMDEGTGLTRPTVIKALKAAEKHGFIVSETDNYDAARIRKVYGLRFKGLNNLTSEVKKSNPSSKIIIPRSEKESIKETKKEATEKTPLAPPVEIVEQTNNLITGIPVIKKGVEKDDTPVLVDGEKKTPPTPKTVSEKETPQTRVEERVSIPLRDPIGFGMAIGRKRKKKLDFTHEQSLRTFCELHPHYDFDIMLRSNKPLLEKWNRWLAGHAKKAALTDAEFVEGLLKIPQKDISWAVENSWRDGPYPESIGFKVQAARARMSSTKPRTSAVRTKTVSLFG